MNGYGALANHVKTLIYRLLADLTLVVHFAFIAFVIAGGFAAVRWHRLAWIHLPCVLWGALIELAGWICPLTPLENTLRRAGGEAGYGGGFIEKYLLPVIYPGGLTRDVQLVLGLGAVVLNVLAYALVIRAIRRSSGQNAQPTRADP